MQDPVYPPLARRNPDTIFLFGLCLLAGVGQISAGTGPGTVEALVPEWMALGWVVVLIVGAALVLAGTLWRTDNGLYLDLIGRVMFGPAALAYAVALSTATNPPGSAALAAAPFLGFAIACTVRAWQIIVRLRLTVRLAQRRNE